MQKAEGRMQNEANHTTRQRCGLDDALVLLARTPRVLDAWLRDLPDAWGLAREAPDTWTPFDVVGHLVHGERTDWMPRVRRILEHGEAVPFDPFDRFAQLRESAGKSLADLLDEFRDLRAANLQALSALGLDDAALGKRGTHPALGPVTLRQLLATWVAHDFGHVSQIARVLASQYAGEVGPWRAYLRVISGQPG
jgi:hypothetical protein